MFLRNEKKPTPNLSEQKSPYKRKQVVETAKWWFDIICVDLPLIISKENNKPVNFPELNEAQEKLFIEKLTDLIWEKIDHGHHLGGIHFMIHLNRDNWDLVEEAMKSINLSLQIDKKYFIKIMTQLEQNGTASYQNRDEVGDIYRPDAEPLKHYKM